MADGLIRLMSWLSPAFPTGGFAYSAGLEQAAASGTVHNRESLFEWLSLQLMHGSLCNDAVILAQSVRSCRDIRRMEELAWLAEALAGSHERHRETMDQGRAFSEAAGHWFGEEVLPADAPLPVVLGLACGLMDMQAGDVLRAFLHAFVSNQLQVAIRLSLIGQNSAAALLARLEPEIEAAAVRCANAEVEEIGSCAVVTEIACMNHETLQTRLFLS